MENQISRSIDLTEKPTRTNEFKRFSRVFFGRKLVVFGLIIILLLIITAIFAPFLAPYDPYRQDLHNMLLQPQTNHLLGTDSVGRDTLSRIIYGSRTSLIVGFGTVSAAAIVGMVLGLIAGYFGGWINTIIMRLMDALMMFPMILLALIIAATLGGGIKNLMIALGVGVLPSYARLMRGQVLSIKGNDYITAVRSIGAGDFRTMFIHILPNCFPPLIVLITMMLGMTILAEAGMSFLGIGIKPPTAAWGAMVNDGYPYLLKHPILSFAPGFSIMLVVFSFNMIGDGLRDAFDPRLRGTI